ncbi:dehydrogenase, partial [Thermodesulfobacteriota bacterium]
MELIINNLQIPIEKDGIDEYVNAASQKLKIGEGDISIAKILSKSLDVSNKEQFYYKISLVVSINDSFGNKQNFPVYTEQIKANRKTTNIKDRPIIVGFGPSGMFTALELIDYGIKPVIFERGKKIEKRSVDVQRFIKE